MPDPTQAEIPAQLWLRSGRPFFGTAIRVYICFALIAGALIFVPRGPVFWGMTGAAVLAYFLFPLVIQGLLAPLERRVLAARRREATALLQEVRGRRLVRQFAPHAWLTLQEGRLHLRRGDGRAAARAFTETVRLSRGADAPALISAQAQALLIAEQPDQARDLLQALARRQALSPADHLHLGLALLAGKGHAREALEHVQAAHAGLGDHPRVQAALALALHRADEGEPALAALQRAQEGLGAEPDPFDEGLIQRGVKLLRTVQKAQQKRVRKVEGSPGAEPAVRVAAAPNKPAAPSKPAAPADAAAKAKSARKAKKDERRAARRAAKVEKRQAPAGKPKAAKVAPQAGTGKGAKVKPAEVKLTEQPKTVAEQPVQVEEKVAEQPVQVAEKVAEPPVQPAEQRTEKVAEPPGTEVPAQPAVARPAPSESTVLRAPAPPAGASLFGSLAARTGSGPAATGLRPPALTGGSSLSPLVPAVSRATSAGGELSRVMPPLPGSPSVSRVMPPLPGSPPVSRDMPPQPGSSPGSRVMPPLPGSPPRLGTASGAPALPRPPVLAPPTVTAPVLAPPTVASPVVIPAGVLSAPARLSTSTPASLAQVLPDTDDAWDEMLDALEADSAAPRR